MTIHPAREAKTLPLQDARDHWLWSPGLARICKLDRAIQYPAQLVFKLG